VGQVAVIRIRIAVISTKPPLSGQGPANRDQVPVVRTRVAAVIGNRPPISGLGLCYQDQVAVFLRQIAVIGIRSSWSRSEPCIKIYSVTVSEHLQTVTMITIVKGDSIYDISVHVIKGAVSRD
jgi:hypothetical protein